MDLLKGRVSIPQARYFITLCEIHRLPHLTHIDTATRLTKIMTTVFSGEDATLVCSTIMPDHLHAIFTLGNRLTLDQLMAKFKTLARKAMPKGLAWQRNFFEHRLRPQEPANGYALYIFLNPYRARRIERLAVWPYWTKGPNADFDFLHQLEAGQFPPKEWLEADLPSLGLSGESIGHD